MESEMPIYANERSHSNGDDDDDDKDDYLDPEEDYIIPDGSAVDVDPRPSLPSTPILGFQNARPRPVGGNNLAMFPPREGKRTATPMRAQNATPNVARKETPTRSPIETPTRTPRETPTETRRGIPSPKGTPKDNKQELDLPEYVNTSKMDQFATIMCTDAIDEEVLYEAETYLTVLPNNHAEEAETAIYDDASIGREDFERSALPSPVLQNHNQIVSKDLELLALRSIDTSQRDSLDTFPQNVESQGCCSCYNCRLCFIRLTFVLAFIAFVAAGIALTFMFAFPEFIAMKNAKCSCTSDISVLNAKIASLNNSINYLLIQMNMTTDKSVNMTV